MFKTNKINRIGRQSALVFCAIYHVSVASAEPLKTDIPANINIPSQPLGNALKQFATQTGKNIIFDKTLVNGKTAPPVKGNYGEMDALKRVLEDSGLEATQEEGAIVVRTARPAVQKKAENLQMEKIEVRAKRFYEIGPLPGLGLTKEQIPGNVQSITAKEIKETHSLSITDLMNRKLQSVNVNDYQGNPFQMDVTYRGFTAGPQIGTPQGLSVFFDGIRVNEPFGDVVNWDMIPMNALASVDVFPGTNPIFGLNTLGGAFTVKTKDGFNNEGVDAEVLTGSFGRKQLQVNGGWNNGTVALFGAGNLFLEDGWRKNSPSKVNQFFGKASYRGDKLDLNLSTLIVGTDLTGNGLLPSEEYARNRNSVFTSPDTTENRLQQFQLSSSYFVSDSFTLTGQMYRRNSKRHQVGADVMRDYSDELTAKRLPNPSEVFTCLYRNSDSANAYGSGSQANRYGIPDYLVVPIIYVNTGSTQDGSNVDFDNSAFGQNANNETLDINNYTNLINTELPQEFVTAYRYLFEQNKNFREFNGYMRGNKPPDISGQYDPSFFNQRSFSAGNAPFFTPSNSGGIMYQGAQDYFFSTDPSTNAVIKNYVFVLAPVNSTDCAPGADISSLDRFDPITFQPILVDGFGLNQPGVVEGTPTALITDNQIDQITDGVSIQLNWNLDHHKLMVGASIDSASAEYRNEQRLGFLDANRNGYLDPAQAHPQFAAAFVPYANNDFEGTNITKSIYFSETWTPTEKWNFSASGRYNQTRTKNKIAARSGFLNLGIGEIIAEPDRYNICGDTNRDGTVTLEDCAGIPLGYRPLNLNKVLDPAETEKFSYYSFNPSLGATWQATENLNIFANWSKGSRTPSAIELGCAFDKTPIYSGGDGGDRNNPKNYTPKSLYENRQCTLPTTLSGDPYLPQVRATTYDLGMRGNLTGLLGNDRLEWNIGAYQTDLKDDIYFVAVGNGQGFFDSIGNTRRRGLEAGLSGKKDKWRFGLNYGLTDATFEDNFRLISIDNSSSVDINDGFGQAINVKKGSRMPGIALHNLNANIIYEITPKWQIGFSAVMHSESFVRGNENNKHQKGVVRLRQIAPGSGLPGAIIDPITGQEFLPLPPTNNPGKVPGYATFNFQTSYRFNSEWTATMQVINLFDKEYFTAGRLGSNPFSPSIFGAIGPSGYNHNSGDWQSTNFIAPSAPRGVWFSLNYTFDPSK